MQAPKLGSGSPSFITGSLDRFSTFLAIGYFETGNKTYINYIKIMQIHIAFNYKYIQWQIIKIKIPSFTENRSKSACLIITLNSISQYNYTVFN